MWAIELKEFGSTKISNLELYHHYVIFFECLEETEREISRKL
jgi:hypothetical protein